MSNSVYAVGEIDIYSVDLTQYDFFRDTNKTVGFLNDDTVGKDIAKLTQETFPDQKNLQPEEIANFLFELRLHQVTGMLDTRPSHSAGLDDNGDVVYNTITYVNTGDYSTQEVAEVAKVNGAEVVQGNVLEVASEEASVLGVSVDDLAPFFEEQEIRGQIDNAVAEFLEGRAEVYDDPEILSLMVYDIYKERLGYTASDIYELGDYTFSGPMSLDQELADVVAALNSELTQQNSDHDGSQVNKYVGLGRFMSEMSLDRLTEIIDPDKYSTKAIFSGVSGSGHGDYETAVLECTGSECGDLETNKPVLDDAPGVIETGISKHF